MSGKVSHDPAKTTGRETGLHQLNILGGLGPKGRRWLLALSVFILVELAVLGGLFERSEMGLYDGWFRLRGVQDPGDKVVIVAMDEASVQKLGRPPWPRTIHARLLEKLKEAKVVGFDFVYDSPTNPEEDKAFGAAIAKHGRVVLASKFIFERDASGEMVQVFMTPRPEIMTKPAGLGFANMPTDPDNVVRHSTLVDTNTFELPFPSLGLAVALVGSGFDQTQLKLEPDRLTAGNKVIPLNSLNQAMPNFWGPQGTFKTYSYADVVGGNLPPAIFKDKIVLFGATAEAEKDFFSIPFTTSNLVLSGGLPTPGVEIHAAVVQSFLEGSWYRRVSPVANQAFLILAVILTTLAVGGRSPWVGLAGALTVVAAATGMAAGFWWNARLWLNLAAPLTLILLTYAVLNAAEFVQAELGRRRIRAMFNRYVSPDVVEELMRNPGSVSLGGRRQTVTVMFCDIRGFTAYSENKDPEEVVNRLNEYLTALTQVIFHYGGTLDKYLGDGLMAIFGAPVYYPDHVQRAIQVAVEIQEEIDKLNQVWEAKNQPPLKVGVGINTGSVLVGNVGSPERMDYTVIGEDVNLASRVEGLTKNFNTLIVISERSVRLLEGVEGLPWKLRHLGHAEVKGFTAPVGVYTVAGKN
ncbi:MAG: adenylate/guanylate cyclase domain-containing protein [Clostridia bacterium]|nr:adenylate/guanylate cyclase domain-containing protein [Clostridia bacterium]